jgi:hypothetical protein
MIFVTVERLEVSPIECPKLFLRIAEIKRGEGHEMIHMPR